MSITEVRPQSETRLPGQSSKDRGLAGLARHIGVSLALFAALSFSFRGFMLVVYPVDFLEANWITTREVEHSYIWAVVLVVVLATATFRSDPKLTDRLVQIHFVFPILPMLVLFAERGAPVRYVMEIATAFLVVVTVTRAPGFGIGRQIGRIRSISLSKVPIVVAGATLLFVIGTALTGGLSRFNLNFDKVYEYRGSSALSGPPLFGYLNTNLIAFGIPLMTALAAARRRLSLLLAVFAMTTAIFGFTSQKSHFFMPFIVLAIYYLFGRSNPTRALSLGLIIVCLVSVALITVVPSWTRFGTWTVRRGLFAPAYLNFIWNDFFGVHGNPLMHWSDSSISLGLTKNPYGVSAPIVVGAAYDGKGTTDLAAASNAANTGWMGSGYAHFRYAGLLIYAVVVGGLLRPLNSLASAIGERPAAAAATFAFFQIFTTTDLPAAVLSHGIFLLIVTSLLIERSDFLSVREPASAEYRITTPAIRGQ